MDVDLTCNRELAWLKSDAQDQNIQSHHPPKNTGHVVSSWCWEPIGFASEGVDTLPLVNCGTEAHSRDMGCG